MVIYRPCQVSILAVGPSCPRFKSQIQSFLCKISDVAVLVDSKIDVYRVDSESFMDYQTHQALTSGKLELQILFWYWLSVTQALLKLCLEVKHQYNK